METAPKITLPLSVFISYAPVPKDEALRQELEAHLSLLKKLGFITTWHHRKMLAGSNLQQELSEHLEIATLILLLISADFLASEECYKEMQVALERNKAGDALVIPIILRKVHLESTPFKHLLCLPHGGRPVRSWKDTDEAFTNIVDGIRETIEKYPAHQNKRISDKEKRLHALIPDHNGFLKDRLESFVGRQQEIAEIQDHINQRLSTGGYVTITGQAGQGKSSIIAKLIETSGVEQVAYHFISINPGPDHQVGLLRNLMARLILKYKLSDLYVASDNRAALRDYFPKVLTDVANQDRQEIIFIDGLDQLEEDFNGVRDLSFLPTNPPPGIVFVLGTRPNDTMKPLELLKPHNEYRLPNLSRQDFDRILQRRDVSLKDTIADQFYKIMGENALYLDLVAKELTASDAIDPLAIITRITANPTNIFTLSLERLKRQGQLWERVIYPVLGALLTTQEPLPLQCLKDILQVEDYKLRDGIVRLGGLLTEDIQRRYSLFHLKLRDYLHQDTEDPKKEYIFSTEEEEGWHARLALWCEQGQLSLIWQDTNNPIEQGRRMYARQHYITHLYYAHKWQQLFEVLDEGSYGHAKERYDVTTRSYVQDLNRGCQAAAKSSITVEDAMVMLPRHWQYMLLHSSLRSRADRYPREMFQLFLLLRREQEVLGLVELLTKPLYKVEVLLLIAKHFAKQPGREVEYAQIFFRASDVACAIEQKAEQTRALSMLVNALAEVGQWEQAEVVARTIEQKAEQTWALSMLVNALAEVGQWEQAEVVARTIEYNEEQARTLSMLVNALAEAGQWEQAEVVALSIEESDERVWALSILAGTLAKAGQWEQAKRFWTEAEVVALSIEESDERAWMLSILAGTLAKAGQWEQAKRFWTEAGEEGEEQASVLRERVNVLVETEQWEQAEVVACTIEESEERARALRKLVNVLAEVGQWEYAEAIAHIILENPQRARELSTIANALAKAGQWEQAKRLWTEAEAIARTLEESYQRTWVLRELAKRLTETGQWEHAEIVVHTIEESSQRIIMLSTIANALAKAGQWEQAKRLWTEAEAVAHTIEEIDQRIRMLIMLANMLIVNQQQERAEMICIEIERVMFLIEKDNKRSQTLDALASALAEAGQWEQAEAVAHTIEENHVQSWTLSMIASVLANAGQWEWAKRLWAEAEAVAQTIEENHEQARALSTIASALAEAGQWERAEAVAQTIEENHEQARALSMIASVLAKVGQQEQAKRLWAEAEVVAQTIEENHERPGVLSTIASALAEAGQWERAEVVAHTIEESDERARALNALISALAEAGQWERAEAVVQTIEESDERANMLNALASTLAKVGQQEQAKQLWIEAEVVAHTIKESYNRANVLNALISALVEAGQWERAEVVAHTIERSDDRARALNILASALVEVGQWNQAKQFWTEAEAVTHIIEEREAYLYWDRNGLILALRELVNGLAKAGQWEQAEAVARTIEGSDERAIVLSTIAVALARVGQQEQAKQLWIEAEVVARTIKGSDKLINVFKVLVSDLLIAHQYQLAISLIHFSWLQVEVRDDAFLFFPLALGFIPLQPEIGDAFYRGFQWVDAFLNG